LALALGARIRHILVDEFQDTSVTQFELIEKLTAGWEPGDGRTLFLVGDPMQSIYRFRQADVGLFLKARNKGIGTIRLEPLKLSVNFRSQPEIVEWINRTFQSIFPPADDLESGAIAYSASVPGAGGAAARIGIHAFRQAREEADRVMELVTTVDGHTTAVLVRSRAHLIEIVAELRRRRIAFQAIEIDQLGERQVIEDLMALTFALLHAADRVSWLAILRAPWCGLTLEDLHVLAAEDHHATVWDLLQRRRESLSEDGRQRIEKILPVMELAIAARGREPLRDLVESTWQRLGGPACVEDETALEDAAAYFDLLERLAEGADLADFDRFRDQVNALFARPNAAAGNALQLMTIHKAKGLEFDTVILPGLNAIPRSDDQRLLLWLEHRGEFLLAPISESGGEKDPIYGYLASLERRKSEQETARLLYVAATRARRSLHLLGCVETKTKSGSFLKVLWPALGEHFANPVSGAHEQVAASRQTLRRLRTGWRVPMPPPPVRWTRPPIERRPAPEIAWERTSERARRAGAVLHVFLQRVAREGLACWDDGAVLAKRGAYLAVLVNLGVPPGDLAWSVERVESGLLRTLRDPRGRWVLDSHAEAASELPVTGLIEGDLCAGVIDRTFVDENGVRWIIDFKTGTHEGAALEHFLEQEKERYREQLERYALLMSKYEDRPIRLGLYFPLLGEWLEWAASAPLRRQALLFEM
jgi:ATP-dependent helicase/nuclease subunit A